MANDIKERKAKIISAIVEDYIRTASPVSSRSIALKYCNDLSPATIRNIMAELEEDGFLIKPHTSAGRVPTEEGFRFYVQGLFDLKEPHKDDKMFLKRNCEKHVNMEDILADTAKAVSVLTGCAGIMFAPKASNFVIRHINILPTDRGGAVMLMVSTLGVVRTRFVEIDLMRGRFDFEKASNYLNSIGKNLTIREMRDKIVEEMKNERSLYDELLKNALRLGSLALDNDGPAVKELYVEGVSNILSQPEFRDDFERLKGLFEAFEEKSLIVKIIDNGMCDGERHVFFGSDTMIKEFRDLSFVTAPCGLGHDICGTIGVVGPLRMDYSRIIPMVDYAAGLLSKVL